MSTNSEKIKEEINSNNYKDIKNKGREKWKALTNEQKKFYQEKSKEEFELFKFRKNEFKLRGYFVKTKTLKEYLEENEKSKYAGNIKRINYHLQLHQTNCRRAFTIKFSRENKNDENDSEENKVSQNPFDLLNQNEITFENSENNEN